jgi:hypothetical protein
MPEESRYVLPKKKHDYWTLVGCGVMFGGVVAIGFAIALVGELRDRWVFGHMTDKDHLWEAKVALDTPVDLNLSLRHLGVIPANSAERAKALVLEREVRQKESEMATAESARKAAQAERTRAATEASEARAASVRQFETALKNVGYDLSAEASGDSRDEVVITSKEFEDTDRRIRFLSFLRKEWGPAGAVCWQGFSKVRLRSSKIPLVGFSESYSLCQ